MKHNYGKAESSIPDRTLEENEETGSLPILKEYAEWIHDREPDESYTTGFKILPSCTCPNCGYHTSWEKSICPKCGTRFRD